MGTGDGSWEWAAAHVCEEGAPVEAAVPGQQLPGPRLRLRHQERPAPAPRPQLRLNRGPSRLMDGDDGWIGM